MKLYLKLAAANMKNNRQFCLPYLLTGIISVAMFYLMMAMQDNPGFLEIPGGGNVKAVLTFGVGVVGVFVSVFLFYTNNFIMKRRKKELGIYNILGMEKKHIAKVLFLEMLFVAAVTITGGLAFGIAFNKLMTMFLYRLTGLAVSIPFMVSVTGCMSTLKLFLAIYAAAFFYNLMQVKLANPIQLLHGSNVGEREPKTKILIAIIGVLALGGGYYTALTTTDEIQALTLFFVAVILVIVGTYCLFTAGSIALLKSLRKNKKYYYQTRHFTTVSGMLYRMKQNAVGLANICILSTMVLVTVSTTASMYIGVEDVIHARFPVEISATAYYRELPGEEEIPDQAIMDSLKKSGRVITREYGYLNYFTAAVQKENKFRATEIGRGDGYSLSDVVMLEIVTEAGYEAYTGTQVADLETGEIIVSADSKFQWDTLVLEGEEYVVREVRSYAEDDKYTTVTGGSNTYIIVPDETALSEIFERVEKGWKPEWSIMQYRYEMGFDIDGTAEEKTAAAAEIGTAVEEWENAVMPELDGSGYGSTYLAAREASRSDYYSVYGGLLFLGLFLGTLFLMVTVLIIFYKQISEGYEDKERFAIMEKVGMSNDEVKRTIRSQVLTVFFLPLVAAVVHVAMAFPMITKLLSGLTTVQNIPLFAACVAGTAFVFFLIYLFVFFLTSRSYYKIVGNQV